LTEKEEKTMTDRKELESEIQEELGRKQFSLTNDELFGYVFGSEERRDLTADLLSAVLEESFGHSITGISFSPAEEFPIHSDKDQFSRFAARCELGGDEHIFVELQLVNFMESTKMPLICCAMMLSAQPEYDLHPVATVSLLSYSLLDEEDWRSDFSVCRKSDGRKLSDGMGIHFLEVPKFAKTGRKPVSGMTKLERWMEFFADRLSDDEKKELAKLDPAVGRAYAAAEDFFNDRENCRRYIKREAELRAALAALRSSGCLS